MICCCWKRPYFISTRAAAKESCGPYFERTIERNLTYQDQRQYVLAKPNCWRSLAIKSMRLIEE
ncbi:hypothetical protein KIN20_018816 [Parelaphostrongylus tenuis]|uniref:Uncharacterized protein n=1 Tax=Parelaphostrongylus tenuis TaxID=148309 RepID=A0AAD5MNK1_PARTN|nr:hypothetical protein KIN20_018816 [Parelaphostrongylus tenuis]